MHHSLICVHCGTTVVLETEIDRVGKPFRTHLINLHRELLAVDERGRWADLLEHFRVVPDHFPVMPRVVQV